MSKMIITKSGNRQWYQHGLRHRTDGPAVEYANGTRFWYQNSRLHRTDGPAVEWADGTCEWYINGHRLDEHTVKLINFLLHKKPTGAGVHT